MYGSRHEHVFNGYQTCSKASLLNGEPMASLVHGIGRHGSPIVMITIQRHRTARNFVDLQRGGQEETNGQNDVAATTSTLAPATSRWHPPILDGSHHLHLVKTRH